MFVLFWNEAGSLCQFLVQCCCLAAQIYIYIYQTCLMSKTLKLWNVKLGFMNCNHGTHHLSINLWGQLIQFRGFCSREGKSRPTHPSVKVYSPINNLRHLQLDCFTANRSYDRLHVFMHPQWQHVAKNHWRVFLINCSHFSNHLFALVQ